MEDDTKVKIFGIWFWGALPLVIIFGLLGWTTLVLILLAALAITLFTLVLRYWLSGDKGETEDAEKFLSGRFPDDDEP